MVRSVLRACLVLLSSGCASDEDPDRTAMDAAGPVLDASHRDAELDAAWDAARVLDASDARVPDASVTLSCQVDSKVVWNDCFQVEAGRCYDLTTKIDDKWLDLDVPADLSGWIDKQDPRFLLFTPFRRVAQDDIGFYQFATCVNQQLDQCSPVGAQTTLCPKVSGKLSFFVNDASGFEGNDVGTATVTLTPK